MRLPGAGAPASPDICENRPKIASHTSPAGGRAGGDDPQGDGTYWLASCVGCAWKTPAPDTWEAIRKAATTAGTLISLRN
jgi:hypothetical protein